MGNVPQPHSPVDQRLWHIFGLACAGDLDRGVAEAGGGGQVLVPSARSVPSLRPAAPHCSVLRTRGPQDPGELQPHRIPPE